MDAHSSRFDVQFRSVSFITAVVAAKVVGIFSAAAVDIYHRFWNSFDLYFRLILYFIVIDSSIHMNLLCFSPHFSLLSITMIPLRVCISYTFLWFILISTCSSIQIVYNTIHTPKRSIVSHACLLYSNKRNQCVKIDHIRLEQKKILNKKCRREKENVPQIFVIIFIAEYRKIWIMVQRRSKMNVSRYEWEMYTSILTR